MAAEKRKKPLPARTFGQDAGRTALWVVRTWLIVAGFGGGVALLFVLRHGEWNSNLFLRQTLMWLVPVLPVGILAFPIVLLRARRAAKTGGETTSKGKSESDPALESVAGVAVGGTTQWRRRLDIGLRGAALYGMATFCLWGFQEAMIYGNTRTSGDLSKGFSSLRIPLPKATRKEGWLSKLVPAVDPWLPAAWSPPAAGRPTVLFFPPQIATLEGISRWAQPLAGAGFGVLVVLPRGYDGSPGKPSQAAIEADLAAVPAFLSGLVGGGMEGSKTTKPIVAAWSLGTAVAVSYASRFPAACLVLAGSFDSLVEVARDPYPIFPIRTISRNDWDSSLLAPRVPADIPVRLLHGEDDQVVAAVHGKALAAAFGPRAELTLIPDHGHVFDAEELLPAIESCAAAGSE